MTTGQKLNRLPQGKIFGMTVTEPDTSAKSKLESSSSPIIKTIFNDGKPKDQKDVDKSATAKLSVKSLKVFLKVFPKMFYNLINLKYQKA